MSKFEDGSYQCIPGPALIAKILAGRCKMHYTRAAVGEGTIPEGVSPKELTEPPDYVMEAKIAAVTNPLDGECQVTVQINSSDVARGFYAMGIMLYAEDPDLGEVPYTYLKLEDGLEWIRPASSAVGKLATFDLISAVGAVDAVSAAIDPDAIATVAELDRKIAEHNADPDAHAKQISDAITQEVKELTETGDVVNEDTVINLIGQYSGGIAKERPFTVKPVDWQEGEGTYPFYADIVDEDVTEEYRPDVILDELSADIATYYQVSSSAKSYTGYVRIRSKTKPAQEISGTLYLLGKGGSGGGGSYVLPPATANRLGGVKIGDGMNVEPDGTASVDTEGIAEGITEPVAKKVVEESSATDEQVDSMIETVFGEDAES